MVQFVIVGSWVRGETLLTKVLNDSGKTMMKGQWKEKE